MTGGQRLRRERVRRKVAESQRDEAERALRKAKKKMEALSKTIGGSDVQRSG